MEVLLAGAKVAVSGSRNQKYEAESQTSLNMTASVEVRPCISGFPASAREFQNEYQGMQFPDM
jgi:hypothetical protein